jgi:putative nucleotidyltransferase with HDIG domain
VRLMPVDQAAGLYLAQSVIDPASGVVLLNAGVRLSLRYVEALRSRGFLTVYASAAPPSGRPRDLDRDTREAAKAALADAVERLSAGRPLPILALMDAVEAMMAALRQDDLTLAALSMVRTADDATYEHSVNVAALSLLAAPKDLLPEALLHLGLGALLHDIGKALIPEHILQKPGRLSPEEVAIMREHTTRGFRALMEHPSGLSPVSAHLALCHHERLDGSGYPEGLAADAVHPFARIVAVADVFDALTHHRVYKTASTPADTARHLLANSGTEFDREVVVRLLSRLAVYPLGATVTLDDGRTGVVVEENAADPRAPIVELPDGVRVSGTVREATLRLY